MADRENATEPPAALSHLRVVELGDVPAAYAGRLLADLGADVIKVEPPGGAPERRLPPFAGGIEDAERSLTFIHANTNKRGLVLDLSAEGDRDTFTRLLLSVDIFVEATPLGRLESWGFTDAWLEENCPALVTVSMTPFGRTGPYRHYKTSDAITNGAGGFLYGQGDDERGPCTAPSHSAYQVAGCVAATLAVAGVRHRRRSGVGQRMDVSLQEALTFTNSSSIARYTLENRMGRRPGAKTYGGSVTNIYRCKDGRYVHFTANLPHMWREFTQNWMTGTVLSEPQWEDMNYRDSRSDEASAVAAEFISGFTADESWPRRSGGISPPPRSTPWASSWKASSWPPATGSRRWSTRSSAATGRRASPCAFPGRPCGCAGRRRCWTSTATRCWPSWSKGKRLAPAAAIPPLVLSPSTQLRTGTPFVLSPLTRLRTGFAKRSGAKSKGVHPQLLGRPRPPTPCCPACAWPI